jgi:nitroreductase
MLKDLILKNRSYRRFIQNDRIKMHLLYDWIDLARCSPSGANKQPLKYILSGDPEKNTLIFKHLAWAGYLKNWEGPAEGERPAAYIIILGDTTIVQNFSCDQGIAAHSILLGAVESGYGGCIIGSINKSDLRKDLKIPEKLKILLVLALGRPAEKVVIESLENPEQIEYWRDEDGIHHVPKRSLDEIITNF